MPNKKPILAPMILEKIEIKSQHIFHEKRGMSPPETPSPSNRRICRCQTGPLYCIYFLIPLFIETEYQYLKAITFKVTFLSLRLEAEIEEAQVKAKKEMMHGIQMAKEVAQKELYDQKALYEDRIRAMEKVLVQENFVCSRKEEKSFALSNVDYLFSTCNNCDFTDFETPTLTLHLDLVLLTRVERTICLLCLFRWSWVYSLSFIQNEENEHKRLQELDQQRVASQMEELKMANIELEQEVDSQKKRLRLHMEAQVRV